MMKGSGIFQRLKIGPMKKLYQYYTPSSINLAGKVETGRDPSSDVVIILIAICYNAGGVPMDKCFPFERFVHRGGDGWRRIIVF
jgi:hypothetical protein